MNIKKLQWYLNSGSTPSSAFADIKGWWRADTFSGVTPNVILTDKSANGNNMTQAAGVMTAGVAANGQAKFTGNSSTRLTSSLSIANWPITIITVGKRSTSSTQGFFGHIGATGYNTLWYGYEGSDQFSIYNTNRTNNVSAVSSDQAWTARIGYGHRVPIVNGVIQADMTGASVARSAATGTTIGTEYRGLNMDWYETLVWDRTLSLSEMDEVNTYINTRYGMSIPLWSSYTAVNSIHIHGQSNASGRGDRGVADANIPVAYRGSQTNVYTWDGTAWSNLDVSTNNQMWGDTSNATSFFGPIMTMGKDYKDRVGGSVYMFHYATGGTFLEYDISGNGFWKPNDALAQTNAQRIFFLCVSQYWKSLRVHQLASRKPVIKGIFWYQGEEDALNNAYTNAYSANGIVFFNALRAELGGGNPKTIIARLNVNVTGETYLTNMRAQQATLATAIGATLFDTDAYTLRDSVHNDAASNLTEGTAVAALL